MREWLADPGAVSLAIIVASAGVIIGLERLVPYDRGQPLFRRGWFLDLFWYSIVQSYVLGLAIFGFIGWLDGLTGASRRGLVSEWPWWLQLGFFLLLHDLYIYWFHRLQHRVPWLWRIHEAHHSVRDVDWVAGSRSHVLEILINQTVEFLPMVLLGAPKELVLAKATIDAVWGMYIHSNIDVRSGWLQKIVNGPEMHRWHHSIEYTGDGFNYGTKLAVWDWLFGTAHLPAEKPPGYGLDEPFPEGYLGQLAYAFRRARRRYPSQPDERLPNELDAAQ